MNAASGWYRAGSLHSNKLPLNLTTTISMLIGKSHILNDKITAEPLRANFEI